MKKRVANSLIFGILSAFIIGVLVGAIATLIDWRENPSGIFHDDTGTHWNFVFDTFHSWFWPTCFFTCPIITLIRFFIGSKKQA